MQYDLPNRTTTMTDNLRSGAISVADGVYRHGANKVHQQDV
jgi:hypothetical protein